MSDKTVRQACRDRESLDGTDAQALEGALAQAETEIDRLCTALEYFGERNNWLVEKDTKWMQFRRPDPHSVTPSNAYINPWEFATAELEGKE